MLTDEHASRASRAFDGVAPWAKMLRRHRAEWVASLGGEDPVTELSDAGDLGRAVDAEDLESGLVWLDELPAGEVSEPLVAAIRAIAARGRPFVAGLQADPRGAARLEAERLAKELSGFTVFQHLAAGSLILGELDGAGATIEEPGDPDDAVHFLVCVNVPPASALRAHVSLGARVVALMSGYVNFLEEANQNLSEANARFAREHLGIHDAAAAALEPRIAELERNLEEQRSLAQNRYEMLIHAQAALQAPRYRAVDRLRAAVFGIPGIATLFRARSRLIQRRRTER
jgi:hypothetical protein